VLRASFSKGSIHFEHRPACRQRGAFLLLSMALASLLALRGEIKMPIRSLLEGSIFGSPEVAVIAASFEEVLSRLGIAQGTDPDREELIADQIIASASDGIVERRRLVRETLSDLVH
jgi:hypothetical protein